MVAVMPSCPFCTPLESPLADNESALAIEDKHPISPGHCLVVPRRHVVSIFALSLDEYRHCFELVRNVKDLLEKKHFPAGFNLAVNDGRTAGQTVEHAHIHVVPRFVGDTLKPNNLLGERLPGPGRKT